MLAAELTGQEGDRPLVVGDRIEQQHGPFAAIWEVVEIIDAGARLRYCGDVRFVGHRATLVGGNGQDLTVDRMQSFLGRAHWPAARRVKPPQVTLEHERQRRAGRCVGGGIHAWREYGNGRTHAPFTACIACGVTKTDADFEASGRGRAADVLPARTHDGSFDKAGSDDE